MRMTIKRAPLVESIKGDEKMPASDGSDSPKSISINQIKEYTNKELINYATKEEVKDTVNESIDQNILALEMTETGELVIITGKENPYFDTGTIDGEKGNVILEFNY